MFPAGTPVPGFVEFPVGVVELLLGSVGVVVLAATAGSTGVVVLAATAGSTGAFPPALGSVALAASVPASLVYLSLSSRF